MHHSRCKQNYMYDTGVVVDVCRCSVYARFLPERCTVPSRDMHGENKESRLSNQSRTSFMKWLFTKIIFSFMFTGHFHISVIQCHPSRYRWYYTEGITSGVGKADSLLEFLHPLPSLSLASVGNSTSKRLDGIQKIPLMCLTRTWPYDLEKRRTRIDTPIYK